MQRKHLYLLGAVVLLTMIALAAIPGKLKPSKPKTKGVLSIGKFRRLTATEIYPGELIIVRGICVQKSESSATYSIFIEGEGADSIAKPVKCTIDMSDRFLAETIELYAETVVSGKVVFNNELAELQNATVISQDMAKKMQQP